VDDFLRWLPVVILVIQGLMAWGLWSLRQQFMTRAECGKTRQTCGNNKDESLAKTSGRLSGLEANVHALPSRAEFICLSKDIKDLTEKLGTVDGRLGGINRAVDLLNLHHLKVNNS